MELNPDRFNAHLGHMGQTVAWRRSHACPCLNPRTGTHNPACPMCRGKGYFWDAPVSGTVAFSGQKVQMAWAQFGRWENGDVVLTIGSDSPVYAAGNFDRVTMAQGSVPFAAVVAPGERLKFPIIAVSSAIRLESGAPVPVPAAEMPAVDSGGDLLWPQPAGSPVSLSGRKAPEYFCFAEFPQDRAFHHGAALPRRVVMRKFDLFGR